MNSTLKYTVAHLLIPVFGLTGCAVRQHPPNAPTRTMPEQPVQKDNQFQRSEFTIVETMSGTKILDTEPLEQPAAVIWTGATDSNDYAHGSGQLILFGGDWPISALRGSYLHGRPNGRCIVTDINSMTRKVVTYQNGYESQVEHTEQISNASAEELADAAWALAHNAHPDSFSLPDDVKRRLSSKNGNNGAVMGAAMLVGFAAILWGGAKLLGAGQDMVAEGSRISIEHSDRARSDGATKCPRCDGYGRVDPGGLSVSFVLCPRCEGTGWLRGGVSYDPRR